MAMPNKKDEYTPKTLKSLLRDFGIILTKEEEIKILSMSAEELNRFRKKKLDEFFEEIERRD